MGGPSAATSEPGGGTPPRGDDGDVPQSAEGQALPRLLGDHTVLENLPDVVSVTDRDHRVVYLNRTMPHLKVSDVRGTSALAYVTDADRPRYVEAFDRVLATGDAQSLELETLSGRAWSTRLVPVKESGEVKYVLVTSREVTRQKRVEDALREREVELRLALDATGMGTGTLDRTTRSFT